MLAVHQHLAEDAHEGRPWAVRRPLRPGGQVALTTVAPHMEVQAVRGHPQASVDVLFGPRGRAEPQAGVPRAGDVEQVDQGVAPLRVVGGPLLATAVVGVLIGALVEALPYRRRPRVVVVREGVMRAVVPVPGRRLRHCQATCVAMSQLGGTQRDDIAWGGLQLHVGCPGALDGVAEPQPRGGQGPGMRLTQSPLSRVANSGTV